MIGHPVRCTRLELGINSASSTDCVGRPPEFFQPRFVTRTSVRIQGGNVGSTRWLVPPAERTLKFLKVPNSQRHRGNVAWADYAVWKIERFDKRQGVYDSCGTAP